MKMKFTNKAPGAKALKVRGQPVVIEPGKSHTAEFDEVDEATLKALKAEGCTFTKARASSAE